METFDEIYYQCNKFSWNFSVYRVHLMTGFYWCYQIILTLTDHLCALGIVMFNKNLTNIQCFRRRHLTLSLLKSGFVPFIKRRSFLRYSIRIIENYFIFDVSSNHHIVKSTPSWNFFQSPWKTKKTKIVL